MPSVPPIDRPLGPRSVERPADAGSTLLGIYGQPPVGSVDRGGAVQLTSQSWCLDWWILGEDRWHVPAREAAVRQQRLGVGPIVQTALRISNGDILHRTWAVQQSNGPALVVEIENTTKSPVAVALAIRPFDLSGNGAEQTVNVLADRMTVGDATVWLSSESRDRMDDSTLIVPLPHKATTRLLLGQSGAGHQVVPDLEASIRAWDSLITSQTRVALPDDRLTALFDQGRGRLSLSTSTLANRTMELGPTAGKELQALALGGMANECVETLHSLIENNWWPRSGRKHDAHSLAAAAAGISWAAVLHAPHLAEAVLPAATQLAQLVARKKVPSAADLAERGLARLAHCAGQGQAAAELDSSLGSGSATVSIADLNKLAQSASEAGSWGSDEVGPVADAIIGIRAVLVQERWDGEQPELDLFKEWPSAWRGGSTEIHALPTAFGRLSAAIRWHGYRPALLWEFERGETTKRPVRLRCRSLDPDWSTTDSSGETLLAGSAAGLIDAPAEGESFS